MSWTKSIVGLLLALTVAVSCNKPADGPSNKFSTPERNGQSGITYQLLIYSFADSDGDAIGDLKGIESKLDYFVSLGVHALWLSPIHPSSSYHGYDVKDYYSINPQYGTEADFKSLISSAHAKGIKIYLDFVLNHSASAHTWFQQAKSDPNSPYRNYYIFSSNPQADISAGNIPMLASEGASAYDQGQWFSAGNGYKFHSHFSTDWFADFNYGPAQQAELSPAFIDLCGAADKWIDMGVDGFRLDAIKHIYHNAYSDENPTFLKKFYDHCNARYKARGESGNIYMVGEHFSEATEVAPYYKGLPAYFEFSFWWKLKDAINSEYAKDFATNLQTYSQFYSIYRTDPIVATKLSNHDEDRSGSDFGANIAKMKLAAAVLLTAGGQPYIYQGEELAYTGTKSGGDEYVRAPIIWTSDLKNIASAALNSKIPKEILDSSHSVQAQSEDSSSLLSLYRKFGVARDSYKALSQGSFVPCNDYSSKTQICAYYRSFEDQTLLVIHNFSANPVTIDRAIGNFDKKVLYNGSVTYFGGALILNPYSTVVYLQ